MNGITDRVSSPRSGAQNKNVAALTSLYGGSPQKKTKPPMSPMERTLSDNRKGGFASPPARKQKVYKSPVKAAPAESSDDSDSDDDAKAPKAPKPGSFEDSFNKLMASSSSYDEVESDSDSDDSDAKKKDDKKTGTKVRSTPVKSTSNDPNAYSSSERGVSTSEDDDSSSSSDDSDSDDSSSSEDSGDSSDSSVDSNNDDVKARGKNKVDTIQSQSERSQSERPDEKLLVPAKSIADIPTSPKAPALQTQDLEESGNESQPRHSGDSGTDSQPQVSDESGYESQPQASEESGYESHEENIKDGDGANKKESEFRSPRGSTHSALSQYTCDTVALGDVEEDDVAQHHMTTELKEEDAQVLANLGNVEDEKQNVLGSPKGKDKPALMVSSIDEDCPDDEQEHVVTENEETAATPAIDGMENFATYTDTDSDNEEKSRLSHDTPFVKGTDEHRGVPLESSANHQEEQESSAAKAIGDADHDEEQGSAGESELSDDMEDDDEDDLKRSRRRRCLIILFCLVCLMMFAIAYIFVWIFVIRKNNDSSSAGPVDAKQLVGELFGAAAMSQLGAAVAVSGDGMTVAAGAPGFRGTTNAGVGIGQVRVLSRQGPTLSEWAQIGQLLQGDNENDAFGSSVALSSDGTMLAIGAVKRDGLGYVRVFNLTDNNTWKKTSEDIVANQTFSGFGVSLTVSANGLVLAVGAPNHLDSKNSIRTGEVRVFGLFDQAWRPLGEPLTGLADGDGFGSSVSLSSDGRTVAVGSPGNSLAANASGLVQTFLYNIPGNYWQQVGSNIKGDQELDRLGVSVSLSSDGMTLATGMVTNDARGGMVRAYHLGSDSTWTQMGNGVAGEQPYSQWGYSVALSNDGTRVVAGAPLETTVNGPGSGRIRAFDVTGGGWKELGKGISGKREGDNFGLAVAMSGNGRIIFAGAPNFTNTFYRPNGEEVLDQAGYAQVYEVK